MKKNRKVNKKMNANTAVATHVGAIIAFLFAMVILNLLASSSCQQLSKSIGEGARLEDTRNREAMRWEQMKTPDKVESALLRHGLSMRPPKASQNVHMSVDGQPCPGQYSVNTLRQRNAGKAVRYKKAR